MIADRIHQIEVSKTMMISAEAKKLKAAGVDVINLGMGELDFNTPHNIKEAGKLAIDENKTRYTMNVGTVELRTAIASKLKRDNHLEYPLKNIIVTNGAKQAVFNATMTLVNPGEEVIISSPYWVSYPAMVSIAQGKTVVIKTNIDSGFRFTAKQLEEATTPKSKVLIFCNPSNPTGTGYNKDELAELADVIERKNLYVISDDIYEKLVFDNFKFYSLAEVKPSIKDRIVLVNGVSKSYSMTGWRIGYAAANDDIIKGMDKIQSHSTSHASAISQEAAIEALSGPQFMIEEMLVELKERRDFMYNELTSINGIKCFKPQGAFYLFPDISSLLNRQIGDLKFETSLDLAIYLLHEVHVAVVPGSAFGAEGYIRISYSTSMENLKEVIYRLKKAFAKLT
jgi:aspartate aminotransferase